MVQTNKDLHERRLGALPSGLASVAPFYVDRALNAELWDVENNRYLDFATGIAVCNTGHCHPKVVEAAKSQLDRVMHTCAMVVMYDEYVTLAEKINSLVPINNARSVFFNSGAEAVENAVRIARTATKRPGIITLRGGYHGRTALTSTMNGKVAPYRAGHVGGHAPNIYHALAPMHPHTSEAEALKSIEHVFKVEIEADQVAAVVVEPVMGEGGFYPLSPSYMQALRSLTEKHGILLIADEVQTGFGRTGKLFATEHSGIEPDIMTIAKAMGGGMPISGVVGKAEIMDSVNPGGIGGTYSGNPVSCAAALAAIDVIIEDKLSERAEAIGQAFDECFTNLKAENPDLPIGAVRGNGAMCAIEFLKTEDGQTIPDTEIVPKVIANAKEEGLIVLACGYYGNCIRVLPPLTVPDNQLSEGLNKLKAAIQKAAK
ncbi:aspartate aminotransferase family protein [Kordiimonas sp. SCSIO 12610]|uniref:aspartate aminotransferase family protein n=1 Tax=Kordiimonas sp. SCSIO 12610 TaxID=2829597 RepID=UPI00210B2CF2|nr:aminotransferase class III-fold pyridoxal phosphate-dependent enzyme [Kordiimonas sp. SCSIO 12610]UTW54729.1 aminotransferase class III-fold pyridoxal phosphate-dependent enzyme [Kordiimonas sp. SCSIO 12610]